MFASERSSVCFQVDGTGGSGKGMSGGVGWTEGRRGGVTRSAVGEVGVVAVGQLPMYAKPG